MKRTELRTTLENSWLEYASINLILKIESVQRNFTKRLPGLNDVAYSDRLNNSQLQSGNNSNNVASFTTVFTVIPLSTGSLHLTLLIYFILHPILLLEVTHSA